MRKTAGNNYSAEFIRFFYIEQESHEKNPVLYHSHRDFAELTYVCEGNISYRIDNRMYDLKPGNLVIVDQGVLHGEEPFRKETALSCTCAISGLKKDGVPITSLLKKNQRSVVTFETGTAIEKLFLALNEISQTKAGGQGSCNRIAETILNLAMDKMQEALQLEAKVEKKNDEMVRMIIEYLDENYTKPLSLKSLGEQFDLSPYYLAHIFKEETGVSPMKYIMHRKVGEAQSMLSNTSVSISDIGFQLGFGSSSHLSSVFKKYFGVSPKEFRQMYR